MLGIRSAGPRSGISWHRAAVKLLAAAFLPGCGLARMDGVSRAWGGRKPHVAFIERDGSDGKGGSLLASGCSNEEGKERKAVVLGLKHFHARSQGAGYVWLREVLLCFSRRFGQWLDPSETSPEHPSRGWGGPRAPIALGATGSPVGIAGL